MMQVSEWNLESRHEWKRRIQRKRTNPHDPGAQGGVGSGEGCVERKPLVPAFGCAWVDVERHDAKVVPMAVRPLRSGLQRNVCKDQEG